MKKAKERGKINNESDFQLLLGDHCNLQHWLTKGRSYQTNLIYFFDKIIDFLQKGNADLISWTLDKPHMTLLDNIKEMEMSTRIVKWIRNKEITE